MNTLTPEDRIKLKAIISQTRQYINRVQEDLNASTVSSSTVNSALNAKDGCEILWNKLYELKNK